MLSIGERLRAARKLRGLTLSEAAERLEFSKRSLERWELGHSKPHPVHQRIIEEHADRWLREAAGLNN